MTMVSVTDLLAACQATYRSIDVRAAVLRDGPRWKSAFAAIRLCSDSISALRERHRDLSRKHGTLQGDKFRIELAARPFTDWDGVCGELAGSSLRVNASVIDTGSFIKVEPRTEYLRAASEYGHLNDEEKWPALEVVAGNHRAELLASDAITGIARGAGYLSVYQAIDTYCDADFSSSAGFNFVLRMPVFAALLPTEAHGEIVKIRIRQHRRFRPLVANVLLNDRGAVTKRIVVSRWQQDRSRGSLSAEVKIDGLQASHAVSLTLSHPVLGEIDRSTSDVSSILPRAETNPLLETLKLFCPLEELESLLSSPGSAKHRKTDQSTAFEDHIAWLLSLMGFSPIVLGPHEALKRGSEQHGCVDIIATKDATLLVVNCTVGALKGDEASRLWHLAGTVQEMLAGGDAIRVRPILATGITHTEEYWPVGASGAAIPIIDPQRVRTFVTALGADPRSDVFRQFLDRDGTFALQENTPSPANAAYPKDRDQGY